MTAGYRPQEPEEFDYVVEDVQVVAEDGVVLAGNLSYPEGAVRAPAILLLQDSGVHDRHQTGFGHRPLLVLADHLTQAGYAVLRLDQRGAGASEGQAATTGFDDKVGDAVHALATLSEHPAVDPWSLALVGLGEGGLVGAAVGARWPDVAAAILLGTPAVPIRRFLRHQSRTAAEASGFPPARVDDAVAVNSRIFKALAGPRGTADLVAEFAPLLGSYLARWADSSEIIGQGDDLAEAMARAVTRPSFRSLLRVRPAALLARLHCPVLALYGALDAQLDVDANVAAAAAALADNPAEQTEVRCLDGLNHLLQPALSGSIEEYAAIETTMADIALAEIVDWLGHALAER